MSQAINKQYFIISVLIHDVGDSNLLNKTLESISTQTLGMELIQVLVITKDKNDFKEIKEKHPSVEVLLEEGCLEYSLIKSPYFIFVNSGDIFSDSYFKNAFLMFKTQDKIGWVTCSSDKANLAFHNSRNTFFNLEIQLSEFQPPPIFRIDLFVKSGLNLDYKKPIRLIELEIKLKYLSMGYYGQTDNVSTYLESIYSLESNSSQNNILINKIILYRKNIIVFLKTKLADKNYRKNIKRDGESKENYFTNLLKNLIGKLCTILVKRKIKSFHPIILLYFFLKLDSLKHEIIKRKYLFTKAEYVIFQKKPSLKSLSTPAVYDLNNTVIFAHHFWNEGGGERVLKEWISSVESSLAFNKIIDVVVDADGVNSLLREEFRQIAPEQYVLHDLFFTNYERLRFCWELIVNERPKVLFIMSNPYFYILIPQIKKYFPDMKIVDLLHNDFLVDSGWFGVSADYNNQIDKKIVISEYWKEVLIKKYEVNPNNIIIAYNFVDLERFNPKNFDITTIKNENNISLDKKIITFIGRINKQKNIETFLKLVESMSNEYNFEFIFVGNPDESESYVNNIYKKMEGLKNLKIFGHKTNVEEFMKITDVLIVPSYFEGYPLISLEAAAMNTPIVASDIPGLREQIMEGDFGVTYQSMGPNIDFLQIKSILLDRYDELERKALNGRPFVEKKHNLLKQKVKYRQIIENL